MASRVNISLLLLLAAFVGSVVDAHTTSRRLAGSGENASNDRSTRVVQALNAASDAIKRAAAGVTSAQDATSSSLSFAKLAVSDSTSPGDFDRAGARRRLAGNGENASNDRSTRVVQALNAASDAIKRAAAGVTSAQVATSSSLSFAKLAVSDSTSPGDFDSAGARRRLAGNGESASNDRSTRVVQALNAASDAIKRAAAGVTSAQVATSSSLSFAKLAVSDSTSPGDFDSAGARKLLR